MFDEKTLRKIYVENSDAMEMPFEEYIKIAYTNALMSILEDAFRNRVLKKTMVVFPDYVSILRSSGSSDYEIAIFNVPDIEHSFVYDSVQGMIEQLDKESEFYLGIHIVNIENTSKHYPKYSGLKNSVIKNAP